MQDNLNLLLNSSVDDAYVNRAYINVGRLQYSAHPRSRARAGDGRAVARAVARRRRKSAKQLFDNETGRGKHETEGEEFLPTKP